MPELPELEVIRERLDEATAGRPLSRIVHVDPFVVRTTLPLESFVGSTVMRALRVGKHIVLEFDGGRVIAFHLMLAGRLHIREPGRFRSHAKRTRLAIELLGGTILEMTEAGTKHRAWVRAGETLGALSLKAGGLDPLDPTFDAALLRKRLQATTQRIKSALRDSTVVTGIGNAYSDEILFAARLSPMRLTTSLVEAEIERLASAIGQVLREWIDRVRRACPRGLPASQKDWRGDMSVHGRAGFPCTACGTTIARVSFKDQETNYCPVCQNDGKLLADRRLSRFGIRRPPPARG